jgi:polysaccharide biosynthesis protein PslA
MRRRGRRRAYGRLVTTDGAGGRVPGEVSAGSSGPHERGPLRPGTLRSVRVRQARRLASHVFRAVDAACVTALGTAVLLWAAAVPLTEVPMAQFAPFACCVVTLVHLLRVSGAYRFDRGRRWVRQSVLVVALVAVAAVGGVAVALLLRAPAPTVRAVWWWALSVAVALTLLHTCWWVLVRRWRRRHWLTPNVVLVGATAGAQKLINEAVARRDINVLGIFDDRLERSPGALLGVPVLGTTEALLTHRILPHVDLVVVTVDPQAITRVREIMNRLSVLPNALTMMVEQEEETARVAAVAQLADAPLAPLGRTVDPDRRAVAKRLQDLTLGVPLLLLALPLLGIAALAVRLDSSGPVIFRQHRYGFNNEVIVVHKLRTMRREAADPHAGRQVTAADDRITRVGRLLRRTSIDELPQLVNVLRGEMSLVGPRPHAIGMKTREVESAQLVADYAHRHRIKPGLTGWAAVNGSRGPLHTQADVKRRVALDVEYIERQSLALDLRIIALTLPRLLGDRSTVR